MLLLLTLLLTFIINSSADDFTVKCLTCYNGTFTLESGRKLALQYSIKPSSYSSFKIYVNNYNYIYVNQRGNIIRRGFYGWSVPYIVKSSRHWSVFNITVIDGTRKLYLKYVDLHGKVTQTSTTITETMSPRFTSDSVFKDSYNIKEHAKLSVPFSIKGNQRPNIIVTLNDVIIRRKVHRKTTKWYQIYTDRYDFRFKNTSRTNCGKTVNIIAFNNSTNKKAEKSFKINVLFIPEVPQNVTATIISDRCLHIRWDKIESGDCDVSYNIVFVYNKYLNISSKFKPQKNQCVHCYGFDKLNIEYFLLQSIVNDQVSNFSNPIYIPALKNETNYVIYISIGLGVLVSILLLIILMQYGRSKSRPRYSDKQTNDNTTNSAIDRFSLNSEIYTNINEEIPVFVSRTKTYATANGSVHEYEDIENLFTSFQSLQV